MALSTFMIIFFIFEIILNIFHLTVLILMIAKRKTSFKGPFYNIFRLVLIADMLTFVQLVFYKKISLLITDFLLANPFLATCNSIAGNFLTVTQFVGHLLMALNRFTLIWVPLKHEAIWKRQWYTVVILIASCFSVLKRIGASSYFVFGEDSVVSVSFADKGITNWNNLQSILINFSTTCWAAILNVLAFVKLLMRKQNNAAINVNEKNLLYVSLIIFVAQVLRILYNVNGLLFPSNTALVNFFTAALPIFTDISIWSGSISLMFLSSSTRNAYVKYYGCKSKDTTISASNPSALNMIPLTTQINTRTAPSIFH